MFLSKLALIVDDPLDGRVSPYFFDAFLFPLGSSSQMSMEEVSTFVQLHLIQLTHESQVHHGPNALSRNHPGITSMSIEGLYLT